MDRIEPAVLNRDELLVGGHSVEPYFSSGHPADLKWGSGNAVLRYFSAFRLRPFFSLNPQS